MRLIDADALKSKLQARHDNGNDDFDKGYNIGLGTAIDLIDCAPTIETEQKERPQGEWICTFHSTFPQYEPDEYRCSICNCVGNKRDKFCNVCGAQMKGGKE